MVRVDTPNRPGDSGNLSIGPSDATLALVRRSDGGPPPGHTSALTGICLYGNVRSMESAFAIIAEPNRRAMLILLAASERSVGELEAELGMPQPSVSKHLRVLRE